MTHTLGNKESFETPTLEFKEVEKELTQNYLKEGNIKIKTETNKIEHYQGKAIRSRVLAQRRNTCFVCTRSRVQVPGLEKKKKTMNLKVDSSKRSANSIYP